MAERPAKESPGGPPSMERAVARQTVTAFAVSAYSSIWSKFM
jgi:hypothetical protein